MKRRHLFAAAVASFAAAAAAVAVLANFNGTGSAVELGPGLFGVDAGTVWIYAARAGDGAVLFDAGSHQDARAMNALLGVMNVPHDRVRHVFLTHGHSSHSGGAASFPGARVYGGGGDAELFGGKRRPRDLSLRIRSLFNPPPPVVVTDPLERRATIAVEGGEVVAFPMPGHTPGSFGYLFRGALFVGDALHQDEGRFVHTTRFVGRDDESTRRSLAALVEAARTLDFDRVCTGHGGCTPPGRGRELLEAFAGSSSVRFNSP